MSKWKMVRLGDVAEISSGGTPSRSVLEYWQNGTIPWVKIGDIKEKYISRTGEMITEMGLKNSSAKIIPKGALLYTIFATLGEVGILNIDATTNQAIAGIQFSDVVNPNYAYYFLKSLKKSVEAIGRGVAQNNINQYILKNILIPLPPLDEQKRIAEVLDKASELIKKRKEQIRLMDELAKSLFVEMFGDPVENPMGWELGKLSEHTNILTGYPFDSSKYVEDKSQIKICGGLIIMPDKIDWDSANYWSSSEADNLDKYFLQTDDIVLAMDRPWISSGIKVGMIKQDNLPAILIQRTARIRGIGMQQYYLFELFKSPLFTNHCKPTETTVPHIAMGDIKKFVIPLPPISLQNEFADRIDAIEQQKALLQNGLAKMETAYKALMQEYFG